MKTKMKTLFSMEPKTFFLLGEAYLYLGWARFLKLIPFSKVAPSLGERMKETSVSPPEKNLKTIKNISHAIQIMSKYTLWESQCLVKAIAGMKMLEKRGIESTLYLGTTRDKAGKMIAHAWLRSGNYYISGAEGMENFTTVAMFAKKIHINRSEGEGYE